MSIPLEVCPIDARFAGHEVLQRLVAKTWVKVVKASSCRQTSKSIAMAHRTAKLSASSAPARTVSQINSALTQRG
jgi:hypothetical protein